MQTYPLIEQMDTALCIPCENNARTHSDKQIDQIAASINEFGWTQPILVDQENNVLAGHGRLRAAQKLKLKTVPALRIDTLSEAQRRAYMLADNKIALNSGWDEELLKIEVSGLSELGFDLGVLGFEPQEIAKYLDLDAISLGEDESMLDQEPEKFEVLIECGCENSQIELLDELDSRGLTCRALV